MIAVALYILGEVVESLIKPQTFTIATAVDSHALFKNINSTVFTSIAYITFIHTNVCRRFTSKRKAQFHFGLIEHSRVELR